MRAIGDFALQFFFTHGDQGESEEGAAERRDEDREQNGLPAQAGADGPKQFHVAKSHGVAFENDSTEGGDEP